LIGIRSDANDERGGGEFVPKSKLHSSSVRISQKARLKQVYLVADVIALKGIGVQCVGTDRRQSFRSLGVARQACMSGRLLNYARDGEQTELR